MALSLLELKSLDYTFRCGLIFGRSCMEPGIGLDDGLDDPCSSLPYQDVQYSKSLRSLNLLKTTHLNSHSE